MSWIIFGIIAGVSFVVMMHGAFVNSLPQIVGGYFGLIFVLVAPGVGIGSD